MTGGTKLLYDYGLESFELDTNGEKTNGIYLTEKLVTGVIKSTVGQLITVAVPTTPFATIEGKSKLEAYNNLVKFCSQEIKKLNEEKYQEAKQYARSYPLYGSIWESNFDDPIIVFTIAKFLGML
jgi:hypothetical protein